MKRVVIFAHPEKPEALRLARMAKGELETDGIEVMLSTAIGEDLSVFEADMAAVFGGDGTVLAAVAGLGDNPPPVAAFNLGRLGYLAENPPEQVMEVLRDALAGEMQESVRIMIEASIDGERRKWREHVLNEIVVTSRQNGRQLPLAVQVDGEGLMDMRGDGVILATPTGSTAYALSAGGPVVSPELSAIVLTAVCPHQLANRSLVLDPDETVSIRHFSDRPVDIMADGRVCLDMGRDEVLNVRISPRRVRFLFRGRGRYKLLREKLGWGWKATD